MCLNHPETLPTTPVHGNIVLHETSPWCQKRLRIAVLEAKYSSPVDTHMYLVAGNSQHMPLFSGKLSGSVVEGGEVVME